MRKHWKRILFIILLVIFLLPMATYIALKTSWGQSVARNCIVNTLTKELGVDVSIGEIDFDPIKTIGLKKVLILDHHKDTMIFAGLIYADIKLFRLRGRAIELSSVSLEEGSINLRKYTDEDKLNLVIVIDALQSDDADKDQWKFRLDELLLKNMNVNHIDDNKSKMKFGKLDPSQLHLSQVQGRVDEIEFIENGAKFRTDALSFKDVSGMEVTRLNAHISVDDKAIDINKMTLLTRDSEIIGNLTVDYSSISQDELFLSTELVDSKIQTSELGYFVKGYEELSGEITVDAFIEGWLSDLRLSRARFGFGQFSSIQLDGDIKGLPNIDSLWLNVHIHPLTSSIEDLHFMPVPGISQQVHKLPEATDRLGRFSFEGHFKGYLQDFDADGDLVSELGSVQAKMRVKIQDDGTKNSYLGSLALENVELGELLGNPEMGLIDTDLDIDLKGHGSNLTALLKGEVSRFEYKGYSYQNIEVDGKLQDRLFNGFLSVSQPEIDLDFKGLVDLRSDVPEFNFKAEVFQADLARLGFASDLDSTSMTGSIQANFIGDQVDDFEGVVQAQGLSFCKGEDEYFFGAFIVESKLEDDLRRIDLKSNMLDADVLGKFRFRDLKSDFISLFDNVFPSLYADLELPESRSSQLTFNVDFKDTKDLMSLILPGMKVGVGSRLSGGLDAMAKNFNLNFVGDSLSYEFIELLGVGLEIERSYDVAYASLKTDEMQLSDSLRFKDNYYTFNAYRDSVESDLTWTLAEKDISGSISVLSRVFSSDSISNVLYPSQVVMSGDYWLTEGFSEIIYSDGGLYIDEAIVSNGKESISLFGTISERKESRVDFIVEDFQLGHINKFLPTDMVTIDGITELSGYATAVLGKPTVVADMNIMDFAIGGERIGNLGLRSNWDREQKFLNLSGELENQGINEIEAEGRYFPGAEDDNLKAVLNFNGFYLDVLNKLPTGGISHLGGQASGNLDVKGSLLEPDINGELSFKDASLRVNFLNTTYFFNDKVVVRNDYIGTNHIPFTDESGNTGFLNGTVAHENYREWNYDIYAEFEKMMVLNTDISSDQKFYGKVFATGSVSLFGFDRNLTIEIFGKTEPGTVLELPLGNSTDVVLEDFFYFTSKEEEDDKEELIDQRPPTTIELFMEVQCNPDAEVKMIFDEKIGDVIRGRGEGTLTMTLDRAGTFEIFGNYLVVEGDYLFTLQNVVNKRFSVETGSLISFYGDPYQAELDLKTIYKLRASLNDLIGGEGVGFGNRVPVECQMELEGGLLNPDIIFNIEFPGLDPGTESLAQSKLDTEEELNRQVFSLLVLNKFLSTEFTDANAGVSAATTTINEFASSQLSNWLSQISDDVEVGVNYRAGDNITSEELAVALTTQLFNDRLLLTGNFGVQGAISNTVEEASSLIGDFRLEYILTKDGRLRLMVFNETNDYSFLELDQGQTKQGVGLIFQREFDGLFDDTRKD